MGDREAILRHRINLILMVSEQPGSAKLGELRKLSLPSLTNQVIGPSMCFQPGLLSG
jgi:hypothetical protein